MGGAGGDRVPAVGDLQHPYVQRPSSASLGYRSASVGRRAAPCLPRRQAAQQPGHRRAFGSHQAVNKSHESAYVSGATSARKWTGQTSPAVCSRARGPDADQSAASYADPSQKILTGQDGNGWVRRAPSGRCHKLCLPAHTRQRR